MEIGSYYHIADNLHYYEDKRDIVESIAAVDQVEDFHYEYEKTFHSLDVFDKLIHEIIFEEHKMRIEKDKYKYHEFSDPFFQDWYNILYFKLLGKNVDFINPYMRYVI